MQEFLNMGGYGNYVWGAFGLTLVVLIWNAYSARAAFNAARLHVKRRLQAQQETP